MDPEIAYLQDKIDDFQEKRLTAADRQTIDQELEYLREALLRLTGGPVAVPPEFR